MHTPRTPWLAGVLALGIVWLTAGPAVAQNAQGSKKVHFETGDGVELNGFWYPAQRDSLVVLVVTDLGEDCTEREYKALATTLHKKGHAVLLFDFRGCGASTNIASPQLWQSQFANRTIKVAQNGAIDFKSFPKGYHPYLTNDIAAAKAFIDIKNDAGECNSSALVLIGSQRGATLAALWLKSEWYRFKFIQPMFGVKGGPDLINPMGKNVLAAIFISISPELGALDLHANNAAKPVASAGKRNGVPMIFVYNDDVKLDKALSEHCENQAKIPNNNKFLFTATCPVKGGPKLVGRELLQKGFGTDAYIAKYLDNLTAQGKGNNWITQDFLRTQYVWVVGAGTAGIIPANQFGQKTSKFVDYLKFFSLP